jgi:hypothetical protein
MVFAWAYAACAGSRAIDGEAVGSTPCSLLTMGVPELGGQPLEIAAKRATLRPLLISGQARCPLVSTGGVQH